MLALPGKKNVTQLTVRKGHRRRIYTEEMKSSYSIVG